MMVTIKAAFDYIDQLDLQYIIDTMCSDLYSLPRWTISDAEYCARLYKNFLKLLKKHPQETLVPTREIDEFWHNHILHTKKYHADCQRIFGFYLHHSPASIQDADSLVASYRRTKVLYLETFQQPLKLVHRK